MTNSDMEVTRLADLIAAEARVGSDGFKNNAEHHIVVASVRALQAYTGHKDQEINKLKAEVSAFREAILAYAPHKETEAEKLEFIKYMSTYYTDPFRKGDAHNALLKRLYEALTNLKRKDS